MSTTLPGDPASCAALAATLRRRAAELRHEGDRVRSARDAAAQGWVGRSALTHRRAADTVVERTADLTAPMTRLADRLDSYAEALGEVQLELRRVADEAVRDGLVVRDGRVVEEWGISGEADTEERERLEQAAGVLQRRLVRATSRLERCRAELADVAEQVSSGRE